MTSNDGETKPLRVGMITDVHQDIMHDAVDRLSQFVSAMAEANVDFVMQLGDFCIPTEKNREFMDAWERFPGERFHVLGNHDMDGGYRREQTVEFYGMPARFYSFDRGGVHFVVLDGNDPGGEQPGYARFMADDQRDWLAADLRGNRLPAVIVSHQPLDIDNGVENCSQIREILEEADRRESNGPIVGCFSGHFHLNYLRAINNIHYCQINSASYLWVGSDYQHRSYSDEIHDAHPLIEKTCPYQEPLWAVVSIDPVERSVKVEGRHTEWVGASPEELEMPPARVSDEPRARSPRISDRVW